MGLIAPDSISLRHVDGSTSSFILYFSTQVVTDADTVDVSGFLTTVDDAWFTPSNLKPGVGVDISGTTLTMRVSAGTPLGRLHIVGNP